jgi:plasmid stabilization system protein ParE
VKTYRVVLLPQVRASLRQITNYLRRTASDAVATKVRKNMMAAIKKLATMPNAHEVVEDISRDQIVYRRTLQWSYRIIFTVHEEELRVLVVDIDHGAGDPQKLIDKFS